MALSRWTMGSDATSNGRGFGPTPRAGIVLVLLSLAYPFVVPWLSDHPAPRLVPAAANLYLFGVFAWSLHRGPPLIERFARIIEHDDLPAFTLTYCRRVTLVWCGFFAINATTILALLIFAPPRWWSMYTGALTYIPVAALLIGETCFRKWWFRYYGNGPIDRVLARIFPAEATPNGRRSLAYVAARDAGMTQTANSPTLGPDDDGYSSPA